MENQKPISGSETTDPNHEVVNTSNQAMETDNNTVRPGSAHVETHAMDTTESNAVVTNQSPIDHDIPDISGLKIAKRKFTKGQRKFLYQLLETGITQEEAEAQVMARRQQNLEQEKRKRSEDKTPPRSRKTKRAKNSSSFQVAPESSIKMCLVHFEHPVNMLNENQVEKIKSALVEEIDKTVSQGGVRVKFNGASPRPGWLAVDCADEPTRNWLMEVCASGRLLEEADILAVEGNEMPKASVCTIWIPASEKGEPKSILKRIGYQNDLNTDSWKIMSVKPETKGRTIVLSINDHSISKLKNLEMIVHHSLSKLMVKVRSGTGKPKPNARPKRPGPKTNVDKSSAEPTKPKAANVFRARAPQTSQAIKDATDQRIRENPNVTMTSARTSNAADRSSKKAPTETPLPPESPVGSKDVLVGEGTSKGPSSRPIGRPPPRDSGAKDGRSSGTPGKASK